jgi:ABC-2 type transport system permease protein
MARSAPAGREARPAGPGAVFRGLRWRLIRNAVRAALDRSRLRVVVILACCLLIWGAIFAVSAEAFLYLKRMNVPLTGGIVGTVFDLLFLALTILLLFSGGIILYSSLFRSDEASFLLTTGVPADQIFVYKLQGAVAFSSWAFLLLGSPLLIAFGLAFGAPWYYYGLVVLFFVGFVLLPGSLGALACLLIVNYVPRKRRQLVVLAAAAVVAAVGVWVYRLQPADWAEALHRDYLRRLLGRLAATQGPLAPNHWLSRGLQAAARGDWKGALSYLALIWSNGLLLFVLAAWAASRLYRRGYNLLTTGGTIRRRYGGAALDRALSAVMGFLDPQTRLLVIKDFRMFRRDPAHWAQVLIFTGLMVLYFANMRRFYQEEMGRLYHNGISLMNLGATALLLCAYTGRFIYPMLSLEGHRFWILGLLPLRRERLLWGKFAFSVTWSLLIAECLVVFSDLMLGMPGVLVGAHALAVAALALGLSGLSVGLGAAIPNFRETDPSKIAVGFGGTLNLIAGLTFLVVVLATMAAPWHLWAARLDPAQATTAGAFWPAVGTVVGFAASALAVVVPLRLGARALRQMEF